MGFFKSPFRGRQSGSGRSYHPKIHEALEILRNNPDVSDTTLASALHLELNIAGPFIARARSVLLNEQLRQPQPKQDHPPITDRLTPEQQESLSQGDIILLNYSPEELLKQVADETERINFGQTRIIKIMENYGDVWALVGPLVLLVGTIGEVFVVLWERQTDKTSALAVLGGLAIVCVSLAMEGSFLAISWKSATIRNRADRKPGGRTELDRKLLKIQRAYWYALAIGICVTQIAFIIAQTAQTPSFPLWAIALFAIARSIITLVADAYTAFAHQEKPTDGEQALEEKAQREKYTNLAIAQKISQVKTINESQLQLRQARVEATMKEENLLTQLESARMQNKALIQAQVSQQEASMLMVNMMSSIIRAAFDPNITEEERARSTRIMTAMSEANNAKQIDGPKREDV